MIELMAMSMMKKENMLWYFFSLQIPREIYFKKHFSIEFFEMDRCDFEIDNIVYNNSLYRLK